MAEWRSDMENAPRDGDDVLLGRFDDIEMMIVAFWNLDPETPGFSWQTADGPAYPDDWPTHWQRPAPPEEPKP